MLVPGQTAGLPARITLSLLRGCKGLEFVYALGLVWLLLLHWNTLKPCDHRCETLWRSVKSERKKCEHWTLINIASDKGKDFRVGSELYDAFPLQVAADSARALGVPTLGLGLWPPFRHYSLSSVFEKNLDFHFFEFSKSFALYMFSSIRRKLKCIVSRQFTRKNNAYRKTMYCTHCELPNCRATFHSCLATNF
jgi:hypothetical protein